jgi:Bax protein
MGMMYFPKLNTSFFYSSILSLALLSGCDINSSEDSEAEKVKSESAKKEPTISVAEKKSKFFDFLNPLIKKANAAVIKQRDELLKIKEDIVDLSSSQKRTLASFIETYRVDEELPIDEQIAELEIKINKIPAALILAQAANESAWGTSRFAKKGNNYFGQWCFSKGCGLVPNSRNDGAAHEVAKFDSAFDSVNSYILNLNRHTAYELLRSIRQDAFDNGENISGEALAEGLIFYSERREEYVEEIQGMIRFNKLDRFDAEQI